MAKRIQWGKRTLRKSPAVRTPEGLEMRFTFHHLGILPCAG